MNIVMASFSATETNDQNVSAKTNDRNVSARKYTDRIIIPPFYIILQASITTSSKVNMCNM